MREFDLLQHVFAANRQLPAEVLIPPGDDMALMKLADNRLLVAVDQVIDGRHVRLSSTPIRLVGRKAITRSLSDIAAMAGTPIAALVAVALPPDFDEAKARELFDAMRTTCDEYRCPLIGGDIAIHANSEHALVCSVTVLAHPGENGSVTRSGAQAGDLVCVTGPLGGSLEDGGLGRHLTFEPRIELGLRLTQTYRKRLHAMIDISDGLGRDARHIAEMSTVQIVLDADRIPCNEGCDWKRALSDGEDYELLFTVEPPFLAEISGHQLFQIGEVRSRTDADSPWVVVKVGDERVSADELGWQHSA